MSERLPAMATTQDTLSSVLQKFNSEHNVKGSAVVTRDGLPFVSALPASVNRETFAAMAATMMGAAETAAAEIEVSAASFVMAEFSSLRLIAVGAGPELLVVTIASDHGSTSDLSAATRALAETVRQAL